MPDLIHGKVDSIYLRWVEINLKPSSKLFYVLFFNWGFGNGICAITEIIRILQGKIFRSSNLKGVFAKKWMGYRLSSFWIRVATNFTILSAVVFSNDSPFMGWHVDSQFTIYLKGVFAKNERGCRLIAIKKRASIRRKLLKASHTE